MMSRVVAVEEAEREGSVRRERKKICRRELNALVYEEEEPWEIVE